MQKSQFNNSTEKLFEDKNIVSDDVLLLEKFHKKKYATFGTLLIRTFSPLEEVERLIREYECSEYAYIYHDSDKKEDGTLKEPHFHIILVSRTSTLRLTPLKSLTHNTYVSTSKNKRKAYEYLIHKNEKEKYQYKETDIVHYTSDGVSTLTQSKAEIREQMNIQMLEDIDKLSRRELAYKYGRDYMINYLRYDAFSSAVKQEEMLKEVDSIACSVKASEEVSITDQSGDIVRVTMADFISWNIRSVFDEYYDDDKHLPDSREIVQIYYKALQIYQEQRKKSRRLSKYEEVEA